MGSQGDIGGPHVLNPGTRRDLAALLAADVTQWNPERAGRVGGVSGGNVLVSGASAVWSARCGIQATSQATPVASRCSWT